jgi:hypothetical protein
MREERTEERKKGEKKPPPPPEIGEGTPSTDAKSQNVK